MRAQSLNAIYRRIARSFQYLEKNYFEMFTVGYFLLFPFYLLCVWFGHPLEYVFVFVRAIRGFVARVTLHTVFIFTMDNEIIKANEHAAKPTLTSVISSQWQMRYHSLYWSDTEVKKDRHRNRRRTTNRHFTIVFISVFCTTLDVRNEVGKVFNFLEIIISLENFMRFFGGKGVTWC